MRHLRFQFFWTWILPILFWSCSNTPSTKVPIPLKQGLALDSFCTLYDVPSASIAILEDNHVKFWNHGRNALSRATNEKTIYEGASLSKTVLAAAYHSKFTQEELCRLDGKQLGLSSEAYREFFDSLYSTRLEAELQEIPLAAFLNHTSQIDAHLNGTDTSSGFHYSEIGYQWLQRIYI